MSGGPVPVGLVGAGSISEQYLRTLSLTPDVDVVFVADLDTERARAQARAWDVPDAGSVDDLLERDVELVVNLTVPAAHAEVGLRALRAGRHVWSEKPLALDRADVRSLTGAAAEHGVRLSCAPDTPLGAGQQTAQRLLADGAVGRPLSALALVQNPGPDLWHPSPEFLFAPGGGPLLDLGPYYLTALVQLLGPVARVTARAGTGSPTRTVAEGPRAGAEFDVQVPTEHVALLEMDGGATATLVVSFESAIERSLFEVTGSSGTLVPPQPTEFGGETRLYRAEAESPTVVSPDPPAGADGVGRGLGVVELARAIRADEPSRLDAPLAAHVLDVMLTIGESAERGRTFTVESTVDPPALLPAGWDPLARTL